MVMVTFRCPLTGETQTEVLCEGCAEALEPLPPDVREADADVECTTCPRLNEPAGG